MNHDPMKFTKCHFPQKWKRRTGIRKQLRQSNKRQWIVWTLRPYLLNHHRLNHFCWIHLEPSVLWEHINCMMFWSQHWKTTHQACFLKFEDNYLTYHMSNKILVVKCLLSTTSIIFQYIISFVSPSENKVSIWWTAEYLPVYTSSMNMWLWLFVHTQQCSELTSFSVLKDHSW